MRYIDADALMDQLTRKKAPTGAIRHTEGFNDALMRVRSMVHSAPTIQLPELTPDPVTGLVPCGCKGKPEYHSAKYGYVASVKMHAECPDCHAKTAEYYAFMYADDAFEMLRRRVMDAWNTMRGYKEYAK